MWEQKLSSISRGALEKDAFISNMRDYTRDIVGRIKNSSGKFVHDNITRNKCPQCGKYLLKVNSKNGTMLVCEDRNCGYRNYISRTSNARCPNCHKKLEIRGEKDAQIFMCSCGYREKLSAFKERREKEGKEISKREVSRYLAVEQKKNSEPINTALADALSKLKGQI